MSRFKQQPFQQNRDNGPSSSAPPIRLANALTQARKNASLNLSNLKLSTVPVDAFDLRAGLLMGNSTDDSIKAWEIFGEEALVSFDISHNEQLGQYEMQQNNLTSANIAKLSSLKTWRAKNCNLQSASIGLDGFKNLVDLRQVDFSFNNLNDDAGNNNFGQWIPPSLCLLLLEKNGLRSASFFDSSSYAPFANLTTLNMSDNCLPSLDVFWVSLDETSGSGYYNLPNLKDLNISKNKIKYNEHHDFQPFPPSITNLNVSDNGLGPRVPNLDNLSVCLKVLDLSRNKLEIVDGGAIFTSTTQSPLETMNLSFNKIARFLPSADDNVLYSYPNLKNCSLNGNKLIKLPYNWFCLSQCLHYCDFSDNDMTELPVVLGYLPKLEKIIIGGNGFLRGNIKPDMGGLEIKKKLRFLADLPPILHAQGIPTTRYLEREADEDFAAAKSHMNVSEAVHAARGAVGGANTIVSERSEASLVKKDENTNFIPLSRFVQDLNRKNLLQLPKRVLEELTTRKDCDGVIGENYESMGASVTKLNVSRNRIASIEDCWVESLPSLTIIDASMNMLSELPTNLNLLENLKTLELANNKLSSKVVDACFLFGFGGGAGGLGGNLPNIFYNLEVLNLR